MLLMAVFCARTAGQPLQPLQGQFCPTVAPHQRLLTSKSQLFSGWHNNVSLEIAFCAAQV